MTSKQMVSVTPIWQLGLFGKGEGDHPGEDVRVPTGRRVTPSSHPVHWHIRTSIPTVKQQAPVHWTPFVRHEALVRVASVPHCQTALSGKNKGKDYTTWRAFVLACMV